MATARTVLRWLALAAAVGAIVVVAFVVAFWTPLVSFAQIAQDMVRHADELEAFEGAEGLMDWMVAHPGSVSAVVYDVGPDGRPLDGGVSLAHHGGRVRAIASTVKIGVAAAWALEVAEGRRAAEAPVDQAAWDARYLPGTDGGAHPAALGVLGRAPGDAGPVQEADVVQAMIRHSDNAATDWTTDALGPGPLDRVEALGLRHLRSIEDLLGLFLLWSEEAPEVLVAWPDATLRARAAARSQAWIEDHDGHFTAPALPTIRTQARLSARLGPRGIADDYARAAAGLVRDRWPSPEAAPILEGLLDWPMAFEANQARFRRMGAKGGSLPGVIAEVMYAWPKDAAQPRVVVLFLEDLPVSAWLVAQASFAHQDLLFDWLTDDDAVRDAAARLAAARGEVGGSDEAGGAPTP